MAGLAGKIIGSFEEIGKDVVREVVKVPKDVAGKALESLGTNSGQKGQQTGVPKPGETKPAEKGPLADIDQTKDQKVKQAIARAALEQIAGNRPKQKESSVWERLQMEEQQKKEMQDKQAIAAKLTQLQPMSTKRKAGDLYGVNAKKAATEKKTGKDT